MKLNMTRDISGRTTFGLPFADKEFKFNTELVASVEQTMTVPARFPKYLAVFSFEPGADVWVANNATAALPAGAFATTDSELNPVAREVKADDVLHFIGAGTTTPIGVILYAI